MIDRVEIPDRGVWVDIGAGTGENAEYLAHRRTQLKTMYLVDLCRPLLQVAEERIASQGWKNTHAVLADGTRFVPPEEQVDIVSFSYSLTMIPDWSRSCLVPVEARRADCSRRFLYLSKIPRRGTTSSRVDDSQSGAPLVWK
jgi:trans-aconitate methyltransferase